MKISQKHRWSLLALCLVSSQAFANDGMAQASGSSGLIALASAIAMGLTALGGTLGQGNLGAKTMEGICRNPGAKNAVFTPMIIALAMIEAQAFLAFIIAFLLSSKV